MKLRKECEHAKRALSTATTASIICDSFYEGHDFIDNNSRAMFERLNDELFIATMNPIAQVLKDANMPKSDVTDIFPRVQQLLQDFFNGKQPCYRIDPDEAVEYVAAVQAAIIKGDESEALKGEVRSNYKQYKKLSSSKFMFLYHMKNHSNY